MKRSSIFFQLGYPQVDALNPVCSELNTLPFTFQNNWYKYINFEKYMSEIGAEM